MLPRLDAPLLLQRSRRDNDALGRAAAAAGSSALLGAATGPRGGLLVVVDNDADAGALGAGTELDLGALDEGGLGVAQRAVEAREVALRRLAVCLARGGGPGAGFDLLAVDAEEGRNLLGLLLVRGQGLALGRGRRVDDDGLGLVARLLDGRGLGGRGLLSVGHACGGVDGGALEDVHQAVDVAVTAKGDLAVTDHEGWGVGAEVDVQGQGVDVADEAGGGQDVVVVAVQHGGGASYSSRSTAYFGLKGVMGRQRITGEETYQG